MTRKDSGCCRARKIFCLSDRIAPLLAALAFSVPAAFPTPSLCSEKSIIAVMEIHDMSKKFSPQKIRQATEYLVAMIDSTGIYQIVDRNVQERETIRQIKIESYKDCYDERCQVELGRALAADKILRSRILSLGGECTLASTITDLKKETSSGGNNAAFDCSEKGLLAAIKQVVATLTGSPMTVSSPPVDDNNSQQMTVETDVSDGKTYKTACDRDEHGESCLLYGAMLDYGMVGRRNAVEALKYFDKACTYNAIEGCTFAINILLEKNRSISPDPSRVGGYLFKTRVANHPFGMSLDVALEESKKYTRGRELHAIARSACQKSGSKEACTTYSYLASIGYGGPRDITTAFNTASTLCKKGSVSGCMLFGTFHLLGWGTTVDRQKTRQYWELGCSEDNAGSCGNLATVLLEDINNKSEVARGIKLLKQSCKAGIGWTCQYVDAIYYRGELVQKNLAEAVKFAGLGCEYGYEHGCFDLATASYNGIGMTKDIQTARRAAARGCEMRQTSACGLLGQMYYSGEGGPQSYAEAIRLMRDSCNANNSVNSVYCSLVGYALSDPKSGYLDYAEARKYQRMACDYQVAMACLNLSTLLANGMGGSKDRGQANQVHIKACQLFNTACNSGDQASCDSYRQNCNQ